MILYWHRYNVTHNISKLLWLSHRYLWPWASCTYACNLPYRFNNQISWILEPYDHVSKIYTPVSLVYPSDPICPCNWDVMISLPKSWCPCQGPTYSQVSFSIGDTWGPWSSDDSMHMLAPSTGNLSYLDPLIARVVLGALWYQLLLPTLIDLLIHSATYDFLDEGCIPSKNTSWNMILSIIKPINLKIRPCLDRVIAEVT